MFKKTSGPVSSSGVWKRRKSDVTLSKQASSSYNSKLREKGRKYYPVSSILRDPIDLPQGKQ